MNRIGATGARTADSIAAPNGSDSHLHPTSNRLVVARGGLAQPFRPTRLRSAAVSSRMASGLALRCSGLLTLRIPFLAAGSRFRNQDGLTLR